MTIRCNSPYINVHETLGPNYGYTNYTGHQKNILDGTVRYDTNSNSMVYYGSGTWYAVPNRELTVSTAILDGCLSELETFRPLLQTLDTIFNKPDTHPMIVDAVKQLETAIKLSTNLNGEV